MLLSTIFYDKDIFYATKKVGVKDVLIMCKVLKWARMKI